MGTHSVRPSDAGPARSIDYDAMGTPVASADPSSMTDKGHKIDTVTLGGVPEKFKYAGGSLRREDGRFTFDYDEKQRLIAVSDKILSNAQSRVIRRRYIYNGLDRLIGRRVEVAPVVNGYEAG